MNAARSVLTLSLVAVGLAGEASGQASAGVEYKLLATSKTSTMEKELNEAADAGFFFEGVMGGETGFGGKEVVSILSRTGGAGSGAKFHYKLLATNRTGTMQKEMSEAAAAGLAYRGQTVTESLFGGHEVIVIMERQHDRSTPQFEYKLLATTKTGTMQKELSEAAEAGFRFRGVSVAKTAMGGNEVVVITERTLGGSR